jgi:hypothetical protein
MKQSEVDRWMRRQARRDAQAAPPVFNWLRLVTGLIMTGACLFIFLKLIHIA